MRLETQRLILRPWSESDRVELVEGLNNINVSKWLAVVPHPDTDLDAKRWIDYCSTLQMKPGASASFEFAVELKAHSNVIGSVTLNQINMQHGTGGGGIWISETYQGQGLGSEAFGERIRFAFEDLGLRRLENGFIQGNPSSLRMQEKFGYQLEGQRRKKYRCLADGLVKDEHITGLLKEEWTRV